MSTLDPFPADPGRIRAGDLASVHGRHRLYLDNIPDVPSGPWTAPCGCGGDGVALLVSCHAHKLPAGPVSVARTPDYTDTVHAAVTEQLRRLHTLEDALLARTLASCPFWLHWLAQQPAWTTYANTYRRICPLCGHQRHPDDDCQQVTGYDHLNGDHDCGCPGPDTQR